MTHVRTRLTSDFTILHNALAQRRGSAVAVGVGAYILSLPDGAPVTVDALCAHFDEGRITLSRALRELEHAGYLVRRKERWAGGIIRTRTFFRTVPELRLPESEAPNRVPPVPVVPAPEPRVPDPPAPEPRGPLLPAPRPPAEEPTVPTPETPPGTNPATNPADPDADATSDATYAATTTATAATTTAAGTAPDENADPETGADTLVPPTRADETDVEDDSPLGITGVDPQAVVILASLRIVDSRLILSRREVSKLAPAVADWLAHGVDAATITSTLTAALPTPLRARPARILAYRLRDRPMPLPMPSRTTRIETTEDLSRPFDAPSPVARLPWQTCDGGCERAFRAAEPGACQECADPDGPAPEHTADAATGSIASMRTALRESKEARAAAPARNPRFSARRQPWARTTSLA
ncbi:hypothetical protein [Streptomyces sp. NPDC060198]|uniref:hypothetical protein n=1 Tax=Streptomyces sp. NPDC060198 TaxID=3347070 RepID=UPI00365F75F8